MTTNPQSAVWIDGDPLMEAIAAATWEHCQTRGTSSVDDDPRNIAAVAAAVARGMAAVPVSPPVSRADVIAELLPAWEAVYEPGNVSDYLIGYTNDQDAATGMAEAWLRSQAEVTGRLEWVADQQLATGRYDRWFELIERHDDGVDTGPGIIVRRRMADKAQQQEPVPCMRGEAHPAHLHSGLRKGAVVHGRCPGGWDALAQQQLDTEAPALPEGEPTESVIYEVVGDWGVDSADSAEDARAAVAKWLREYPKCGAHAQQRIVRDWPDGAEFYGPWTALPDAPAAVQSAGSATDDGGQS